MISAGKFSTKDSKSFAILYSAQLFFSDVEVRSSSSWWGISLLKKFPKAMSLGVHCARGFATKKSFDIIHLRDLCLRAEIVFQNKICKCVG